MNTSIVSSDIVELFRKCTFECGEAENPVLIGSITGTFAMHSDRIAAVKPEIAGILRKLPSEFLPGTGDGYFFQNLCRDAEGHQWTDESNVMEYLCVLAIASGQGGWCLPRHLWEALPYGLPYVGFWPDAEPDMNIDL